MIKLTCSSSKSSLLYRAFQSVNYTIQNDEIIKQPIIKSYFVGYLKNIYFILIE